MKTIIQNTFLTPEQATAGCIVITHNYNAKGEVMYPRGIGAYPYDCIRKDEMPDAMVYGDQHSWMVLADYVEVSHRFYAHCSLFRG